MTRKKLNRVPVAMWVMTGIFAIYSLLLLFPLLFALNSSLKNGDQDFIMNMSKFTLNPKFVNYIHAWTELEISGVTFGDMFLNSVWFSAGTTLLNVFSSMCLAYGVAKYRFKGRDAMYSFVLIIMVFPVFGTLPARYKLYSNLGFIDSPLLLLAYAGGFDSQFLILYAFFKNVDWSFAESAFIDGASHWTVFVRIMMPHGASRRSRACGFQLYSVVEQLRRRIAVFAEYAHALDRYVRFRYENDVSGGSAAALRGHGNHAAADCDTVSYDAENRYENDVRRRNKRLKQRQKRQRR